MRELGLKLWTTDFIKNSSLLDDAEKFVKNGVFNYLELYALPFSFDDAKSSVLSRFKGEKVVIHAPHNCHGVNIADKNEYENNKNRLRSSQDFADALNSDIIILHPGMNVGEEFLEESVRQFKGLNDKRLAVENLPSYCSTTMSKLHGVKPSEIKRFIDECGAKFCLDFSHAICGANYYKINVFSFLKEMFELNPCMYHICDGYMNSINDDHLHFGEGDYKLEYFINNYTDSDAIITMETGSGIPVSIDPWYNDALYMRKFLK